MKVDDVTKSQISINVGAIMIYHTPGEEKKNPVKTPLSKQCCLLAAYPLATEY